MNAVFRLTLALAGALLLVGPVVAQTKLESDKDKVSYMVGMDLAKMLEPIKDEIDQKIMLDALRTAMAGGAPALTQEEANAVRASFQQHMQQKQAAEAAAAAAKNAEEGAAFLAANKGKSGVHTTASGLQYQVLRAGNGPKPKPTDKVRVHYVGTLLDGSKFDSSYDRNEPVVFALNQVIPGWSEGVSLMPVGSKYKFWIPSKLGYGERATGPIPPNSMLTFEVELLDIVAPDAQ